MVPGPNNKPEDAQRLHLQRRAAPRAAARRAQPEKKSLARTALIPRVVLRREANLAMAASQQTRSVGARQGRRPSKAEGIAETDGQEGGKKSLR